MTKPIEERIMSAEGDVEVEKERLVRETIEWARLARVIIGIVDDFEAAEGKLQALKDEYASKPKDGDDLGDAPQKRGKKRNPRVSEVPEETETIG